MGNVVYGRMQCLNTLRSAVAKHLRDFRVSGFSPLALAVLGRDRGAAALTDVVALRHARQVPVDVSGAKPHGQAEGRPGRSTLSIPGLFERNEEFQRVIFCR